METKFMTYRGYPLVRNGADMYFGYMNDPYVVMLRANNVKEENGVPVAGKVYFYLMSTKEGLNLMDAISKSSERDSLYEALDVAVSWLQRANQE